jgi:predicted ribosomally synthesized peptide with SipW-like signal peptide
MKKKVLLSSVLTIVLCLSLIAGSTFALFTSEKSVNVSVTAGKVEVLASVSEPLRFGSSLGDMVPEFSATKVADRNEITITNLVPGDFVEFDIVVTNNSNVTVDFKPTISVTEDNGLWSGLVVTFTTIDGEIDYTLENGSWTADEYLELAPGTHPKTVTVRIELPESKGNDYQEKTCTFAYKVYVVQGNAQ